MPEVFIIAEAGVNHNGQLDLAKKLIDLASEAGADAIKFQTFKAEKVISKYAPKAEYQKQTTDDSVSQLEMVKKLELDEQAHYELINYCQTRQIQFLSSSFDQESTELLHKLELEVFKIPSGEITNLPYLRQIGSFNKELILSTGMATLDEVGAALKILEQAGTAAHRITVLHCTTEYPTPMQDVNLKAMQTLAKTFSGIRVGYSDHTPGIEVSVAAVAMGATVIEKHFTLDKTMAGPDHKASLSPQELIALVRAIRNIEKALGDGIKTPSPSEQKNIPIARRSIVASKAIKQGELFTETNLMVKRPGTGISPMQWDEVLGKTAPRDFQEDELIALP